MSDRLTVHASSDCDCLLLRSRVAELQGQVDVLTQELAIEHRHHHVPSDADIMPMPEPTQPDTLPAEAPNASAPAFCDRILRPTFNARNGRGDIHIDRLGSAWKLWNNLQGSPRPVENVAAIDAVSIAEHAEELLDVFFVHCWAHLPVLHEPTFRREHHEPVLQNNGHPVSLFLVYMVFAISAQVKPVSTLGHVFSHQNLFRTAVEFLPHLCNAGDITYLQGLLLLCMYGRSEPQSVDMWHTTGLALRTALGLNLHHHASSTDDDLLQIEMAKRLFWSTYVMDRSMSIAMGRPLGIQDSDITVSLPLQLTDQELTRPDQINEFKPATIKDMSTFIHVIKLRQLNADVYKSFHSPRHTQLDAQSREQTRQRFGEQANQWLSTTPRYLMAPSMFQTPEWFQIAYHFAILTINRPSHAIPIPSLLALHLCADSSISLISCYGSLFAKNKVSYSFIALNSIFMAAITLLYTLRSSSLVRRELSRSVTENNIASCLALIRGIAGEREIGERCAQIVERLGKATLGIFDRAASSDDQVDHEFMTWFGIKSHSRAETHTVNRSAHARESSVQIPLPEIEASDVLATPSMESIESAWMDCFAPGFEDNGSISLDFLPLGFN